LPAAAGRDKLGGAVRSRLRRLLVRAAVAAAVLVLAAATALGGLVAYYGRKADAVDVARIERWQPKVVTRILARDGTLLATLHFGERRTLVPLSEIPGHVVQAFLAAEDARFLEHGGFDPVGIVRAAVANLLHGRVEQGASTITQQVIKRLLLSPDRTLERKSQELWLAGRVERTVGKPRILEIYLNLVYLGEGRYGVEEAARYYFGKSVRDVSVAEAAVLAALPKAPGKVTPVRAPRRTWKRAVWVLRRMAAEGFLDEAAAEAAIEAGMPAVVPPPPEPDLAPEVVAVVRRALVRTFGAERLPTLGATVTTTIDPQLQAKVRAAAEAAAAPRGAEAAVIVAEVDSGAVRAHVGGTAATPGMFDRVLQARRQPASAFKPVVYGTALDEGAIHAGTLVPVDDAGGLATVRAALARSNNRAARAVLARVGAAAVHRFARALGIRSPLHGHPSLALGTAEVTPVELLAAYGTIARRGRGFVPRWIEKVEVDGAVVPLDDEAPAPAGIAPATAYRLTELLRAVVLEGTGRALAGFAPSAAGKTGTSDEARDVWFAGFTPDRVAVAWVGRDDHGPLPDEATGARTALPLWRAAVAASRPDPDRSFEAPPPGVVVRAMDWRTGAPACRPREVWYVPPRCSGFWLFESCTAGGPEAFGAHRLCTDPRAVAPLSLPARDESPPPWPPGWERTAAAPEVRLVGISMPGAAEGPADRPPGEAQRVLAPLLAWVDGRSRAFAAAAGGLEAGAAVVRFEVSAAGEVRNLRVAPGAPVGIAARVRLLVLEQPPPPPPPVAAVGPGGAAHVVLVAIVPARR